MSDKYLPQDVTETDARFTAAELVLLKQSSERVARFIKSVWPTDLNGTMRATALTRLNMLEDYITGAELYAENRRDVSDLEQWRMLVAAKYLDMA